jgi:hypothetical protein
LWTLTSTFILPSLLLPLSRWLPNPFRFTSKHSIYVCTSYKSQSPHPFFFTFLIWMFITVCQPNIWFPGSPATCNLSFHWHDHGLLLPIIMFPPLIITKSNYCGMASKKLHGLPISSSSPSTNSQLSVHHTHTAPDMWRYSPVLIHVAPVVLSPRKLCLPLPFLCPSLLLPSPFFLNLQNPLSQEYHIHGWRHSSVGKCLPSVGKALGLTAQDWKKEYPIHEEVLHNTPSLFRLP